MPVGRVFEPQFDANGQEVFCKKRFFLTICTKLMPKNSTNLSVLKIASHSSPQNLKTVLTIPVNLPPSDLKKSGRA